MPRTPWSQAELLLALHLYERIPFGQQHARNPEVIALAERLGRTPGSVAMKLNNLTSLDEAERARGVVGLAGASALDRKTWDEFHANPEVVEEAERLWIDQMQPPARAEEAEPPWTRPTEGVAATRVRLAQRYFRRVVLANFAGRCALTGISSPELLTASHIVPWADAPEHRVNPANGLCLNRLHDGAFDRHLIAFDEDQRLLIGRRLRDEMT
jgi:putative restriction endonuclease